MSGGYLVLARFRFAFLIGILASIFLTLLHFGRDFCFLADDYYYLAKVYNPTEPFLLSSFQTYLARMPLGVIPIWLMFKYYIINDTSWLAIYIGFLIHAFSCALLTIYLAENVLSEKSNFRYLTVVTLALCFFPNTYEVLYWPTTLTYILGFFLLVLSFHVNRIPWQILLLILSYLNSEMFLFPALAILLSPQIKRLKVAELKPIGLIWGTSLAIYLLLRFALGAIFGYPPNRIHLDISLFIENLLKLAQQTFFLHFHKIYFPISAVFILALLGILSTAIRKKWLSFYQLTVAILLILGSGAIILPLNYGAIRALYGAQAFMIALGSVGLIALIQKHKNLGLIFTGIFSLIFVIHLQMIFSLKDKNHKLVQAKILSLRQDLETCPSPCQITLKDLDKGFSRDWVLHEDYWLDFAHYVKNKYYPDLIVTFVKEVAD